MWASALLVTSLLLSPAQGTATGLQLSNVRNTYGELGGTRPDGKFLPGDVMFIGFDIDGITVDDQGRVQYRMAMEVIDKNNKPIFKQDPSDKVDFVPLGGKKLPARAFVTIGLDQEPGMYTLKLVVTDTASKATQTLSKPFEVTKKDFGIVAVYASVDERGAIPAPTTGIIGQSIFVQFGIVGFDRSPKDATDPKKGNQPDVLIEMSPIDSTGVPTLKKPIAYKLENGVDEKESGFTMRFLLPMTRAGKYTVRLSATDNRTRKTATFDLPVTVVPSAN